MPIPITDIGKKYGDWTVTAFIPAKVLGTRQGKYICVCCCGREKQVGSHNMSELRKTKRMSCGAVHPRVELPKRKVDDQNILDVVKELYNKFAGPNPYKLPKEDLSKKQNLNILSW